MCTHLFHLHSLISDCFATLCDCDPINLAAAFLPAISTLGSIIIYPWIYPVNENIYSYSKKHGMLKTLTMQPAFVALPFVLFVVLPISNQTVRLDWSEVTLGVFFVDTVEYWRHRLEHSVPYLYRNAHKEHHMQRPMTTLEGFRNDQADLLLPLIPFTAYVLFANVSFVETMVLASMAIIATYADHTLTGDAEYDRTKFHNVHHTSGWNRNFQQPFFSYWDELCGTLAPWSSEKWCPFIP
jgi:sterol desaturase/sphingolipid hydroxylase (fatty acid hydroxylase superfamily)